VASGFKFVTRGMTNIENVHRIVSDSEDDSMLMSALTALTVDEFADVSGNLSFSAALGQRDGRAFSVSIALYGPVSHFAAAAGDA